ncbi:hypothetical protein [Devosia sp. SD17-2]|jgi:hypothetical protein|uniref:hypothetical protein n=1 Tax=Devosia sp. SD17-2 TaxID=2976459 RepID=UPI0023D85DCD|nr:hypothetical protein [Devosia sp. SD17-2]WEJ34682.1 hypothetical protein NYQ88_07745 [Devosia sp. SD17-2]
MKRILTGAVLLGGLALAAPAGAAPGLCEMTDYDSFDCDVSVDGGGLTFALPDGQVFAFALTADNEGQGYRISADARPGQVPVELGVFAPIADEPGCWFGARYDIRFCAMVLQ